MNRKIIILAFCLIGIMIIGLSGYSYWYNNSPRGVVEDIFIADESDIYRYLTNEFINRISNDSPSSQEFLNNSVSYYSVKKKIEQIEINESNGGYTATVTMETTTTNTRSGFSVTTQDVYRVTLVKEDKKWKIDNYELLRSETVR